MADGRTARAMTSNGDQNPFRSHLLNQETLEMYRDLLNRPLPRLPKLYTLPSRLLEFSKFSKERATPVCLFLII